MNKHDEISILAGGWSASRYDLGHLSGLVVGVNDSVLHVRCGAAVSMDRLWTENRWSDLQQRGIPAWIRRAALVNIQHRPAWLTSFECDHTSSLMSDDPGILNGTNSGLCAVNLAYQMRPRLIRLYGMDLKRGPKGERHWYPPYPWNPNKGTGDNTFAKWRQDLNRAIAQCKAAGIRVELMR